MSRRAKLLFGMLAALVFLAAIALSLRFEALRQERLALSVALAKVQAVMADRQARSSFGIPEACELRSVVPVDTDLFERRWDIWYAVKPQGAIHVSILASRGIAFVPILNSVGDLRPLAFQYEPNARW